MSAGFPTSQETSLAAAAALLRGGGVVVFPTETVYGVGANALDPVACARIFEVKGRPRFNPLIVHLADVSQLAEVAVPTAAAAALAARFWPGPLTLVLPKRAGIDGIVTGDLETVGVRVPAHPLARALIAAAGVPVAAPSANRFMALSPTTVAHARAQLGDSVDAYLDGGPCEVGVESTIVGWLDGRATLLRPGGLDPRLVEAVIGPLASPPAPGGKALAPGMLARHYAPRVRLFLEGEPDCPVAGRDVALICVRAEAEDRVHFGSVVELAKTGDLRVAAARLYSALHEIDAMDAVDARDAKDVKAIVARLAPEVGLGIAINDRLRRAAAPA